MRCESGSLDEGKDVTPADLERLACPLTRVFRWAGLHAAGAGSGSPGSDVSRGHPAQKRPDGSSTKRCLPSCWRQLGSLRCLAGIPSTYRHAWEVVAVKTSIYLPNDLAGQVRAHGISISEVTQAALRRAVRVAVIRGQRGD